MGDLGVSEADGLREFVLLPRSPEFVPGDGGIAQPLALRVPVPLRVIGPGRFERGYLQRLAGLAGELEMVREDERRLANGLREGKAALEMSLRVERGCQRRMDRLELRLEERTQALLASERQHKRLLLALGSMQRENELLRAQLPLTLAGRPQAALSAAPGDRPAPARARLGLWQRLFRARR